VKKSSPYIIPYVFMGIGDPNGPMFPIRGVGLRKYCPNHLYGDGMRKLEINGDGDILKVP
jgi:hypothetical protein